MSKEPKLEYYLLLAAQRSHNLISQFIAIDQDKPVLWWEDLTPEQRNKHYKRVIFYRNHPKYLTGDLIKYWKFKSKNGGDAKDYLNRRYILMTPKKVRIEEMLFRSAVIELIKINEARKQFEKELEQTNQGNNAQNIIQNQMKTGIPSITEQAAEAAHEANRRYCEMIGDKSQKPWGEAEEWQRESARKGVRFKILNPEATPEDQHYEWCKTKYEDGWVYGPEKKPEEKIHNCLVPYSELPIEQRVKDLLFQVAIEPYIEEYKTWAKTPKYFEKALSWLKAFVADTGRDFAMARTGWNGKGLKVKLQIPDTFSKMSLPYLYMEYPSTPASDTAPANHINARVPWIPSQSDMMANDWVIIKPQETADAPTVDNSPTSRAPEPQGQGN